MSYLVGNENVAVILGKYEPSVTCRGTIKYWISCNTILYSMKATHDQVVFGPMSDPRTEVALPAIISAGKFSQEFIACSVLMLANRHRQVLRSDL